MSASIIIGLLLVMTAGACYACVRYIMKFVHDIGDQINEIEDMSNRVEQLQHGVNRLALAQLSSNTVLDKLVFREIDRARFGYTATPVKNKPWRAGSECEDSEDGSDDTYIYEPEEDEEEDEEDDSDDTYIYESEEDE
ncbi:hypothetical protein TWF506_003699 [Arthrobotrys conoides]|uniref:Uncharacterized protein n=1 Tax=Arthrobotrys conoides TaxID=74498 RepID=A0AAN8N7R6_9PEZI